MRPSFIQYGILLAQAAATRADDKYSHVGVAIFDKNKEVLATGYNGYRPNFTPPEGFEDNRDGRRFAKIHAEANALSRCNRHDPVYVFLTMSPCAACASHMMAYPNIKEVYYIQEYDKCDEFKRIFDFYGVKHESISPEFILLKRGTIDAAADTETFLKRVAEYRELTKDADYGTY